MAEVLGFNIPIDIPAITNSGLGTWYMYLATFFILCVVIAVGIWIWSQSRLYNKKIVIFENDGVGYFHVTGRDKARVIKVGDGGEEVLYLRKRKLLRSAYGRKMGKNEYWFVIGQDGYWYNSILGDFDSKMGMLDIEPIDRDMRLFHVAVRKNAQDNYTKTNFMDKYGSYIFNFALIFIFFFGMFFLVDQIGDLIAQAQNVMVSASKTCEPALEALARVDTICSGGSGLAPAG